MKIYVITKGEYSDYHICAVTENPEKAAKMTRYYTDKYYRARVEEYDTDDAPDLAMGDKMYLIRYGSSGDVERIIQVSPDYLATNLWETVCNNNEYCVAVQADSEKAAIKIGAERRAKHFAEIMGL